MLDALAIYAGDKKSTRGMDRFNEIEPLVGEDAITLSGEYMFVLGAHRRFNEHGFYPFGNGMWADQPQWLIDDFRTIDLYIEYCELRRSLYRTVDNRIKRPAWANPNGKG